MKKHLYRIIILSLFTITSCGSDADLSVSSSSVDSSSSGSHVHNYEEPTYAWANDYSTVTASRVCKDNEEHIETETVTTTSNIVTAASCTEDGVLRYTSGTFTNQAFEVQTKDVFIDKLGHDYEISYSWSTDHMSVTANAVCKHDESHVLTETVNTSREVTVSPTCTSKGNARYTSNTFSNTLFTVQTHDEELNYLPHLYAYASIDDTNHSYECSVCHDIHEEAHHYELIAMTWAYRVNKVNYVGTRTYKCTDCDHEWIQYHWDFEYEY